MAEKQSAGRKRRAAAGEDLRRHPRIPEPPLQVSGVRGCVRDVSLGGFCLDTLEVLQPGEQYELILTDAWCPFPQQLRAAVVWCEEGRAGLEWVQLDQEQQRWLETRFDDWLTAPHSGLLQRLEAVAV